MTTCEQERRLLDSIDEAELVRLLQRLVRANSENPTGDESAVAAVVAEELEAAGIPTRLQPVEERRANVIAELPGRRKAKLLFNGHMDTVPAGDQALWRSDPWGADLRDGNLYGLGSADMKAGVAAMLIAVQALHRCGADFERGLLFTAVVDEEVGFKGTTALIESGLLADCEMACVSEPTSLRIGNRLKGALEFSARTFGRSAHTGIAFAGDNAIYKMGRYLEKLRVYNDSLAKRMDEPELKHPTVNAGKLTGGVGVTLVPDRCELEFDRQVLPGESMDEAEREIRELTNAFSRETGIEVELTLRQRFANWTVADDAPIVTSLANALEDLYDHRPPQFTGFNGYAEVELLASAGIPSVLFGPGSLDVAHAPNEFVPIREVVEASRAYALWAYRYMTSNG
ncbi:M20 family metallopeptidase [Cohnella sp. AR92]|uniref:M20 family metallopeptidase n=1 Tax=Cohnella sp. AR92 TaxID=648716 RepID=UPI000F8E6E9F|nr:M20 family metallopeptidase [Cohnella sp. AR92]RUS46192.1 M20 family peptidase [Cohnella sp. AR92]